MDIGFWLSLSVFLASLHVFAQLAIGMRRVGSLREVTPAPAAGGLRVSVIFSALNEAGTIEPALRSVLALDYPNLEIIAINDRSTDGTGAILDRLSLEHPALRVLHIDALPAGWLGKNHALHQGGKIASGEYFLFTDADVVFESSAITRAVAHCEQHRLDHLVVVAEFIVSEHLLAMLLLNGMVLFYSSFKPWKVRTSRSHYFGMGAFNMVRATAYRHTGGHQALALEVVDDIMLGKRMNTHGFRQDVLLGRGTVSIEWYRNAREMMQGLRKNSFAMLDYSLLKLLAGTVLILVVRYWPWLGLFITGGAAWWLNLATLVLSLLMFIELLRLTPWSRWCLLHWPAIGLISLFIIWQGVILTLVRGGIDWRGTRYRLADLKRAHRDQDVKKGAPQP